MSVIFRSNSSKKEKAFFVILYGSLPLVLYTFHANFSPSQLITDYWLAYSFIFSLFYVIPLLIDTHPKNKIKKYPCRQKNVFYSFIFVIAFALSSDLVLWGIPNLITQVVGNEFKSEAVVLKKDKNGKGCRRALILEDIGYGMQKPMCVDNTFWNTVSKHDIVLISGYQSMFGKYIKEIEFIKNR